MKYIKRISLLFLFVFFFLAPHSVSAKLYINEFSSGTSTDWIEIYNDSDNDIPLSAYSFRDSSSTNKLELNGILSPKGYIVFEWSDRLNNTGDIIKIVKTDQENEIEDQVTYGNVTGKMVDAPSDSQYAARSTDGGSSYALYSSSTKGFTNVNATPAPTSTPSPSETPKPSQTPTKSPTSTKAPSTATSTPTAVTGTQTTQKVLGESIARPSPTVDYHVPTAVLAQRSVTQGSKTTPSPTTTVKVKTLGISAVNPAVVMMGVGTLFLLSCFGYGYHLYKRGQL